MPRKLKVYTTSIGFYDLAIAAPSMKAALAAWGADSNLFHQNFAREVDDADIVKATMNCPGVVLKRPVGSTKPFTKTSALPDDIMPQAPRAKPSRGARSTPREPKQPRPADPRRHEAKRAAAAKKRDAAMAKAEASLKAAQADHDAKVSAIAKARAKLDARDQGEADRWEKAKRKLESSLTKAKRLG